MWIIKTIVDSLITTFVNFGFKTVSMFVEDRVCHFCLSSELCKTIITGCKYFISIDKEDDLMVGFA